MKLLESIPNARAVMAWGMYDLANQSFQLLVNTLLFGIFLGRVVIGDPLRGKGTFGAMVAVALIIVVILSPGLGAWADARGVRKRMLIGTGVGAVVLTALLCVLGPGMLWAAAAIYIAAAVLVGLGENFLGSFLPFLSTPQTVGRISAIGWTMSYIGALLLLGVTGLAVFVFQLKQPAQWRWLFGLAAVWFAVGMVPAALVLPEPPSEAGPAPGRGSGLTSLFVDSMVRLRGTFREAVRYRQLMRFLGVFFVYSLGTNTVVYFLGQIGDDLGFEIGRLIVFSLVMAVAAGASAMGAAKFQDRLGHRRTIAGYLGVWIVSTGLLALMARYHWDGRWFWPIAAGLGFALGGIGTASRAAVGAFTPPEKAGEFFGLWGMVYKLAGVIGLIAFAWANRALGQAPSLFVLAGFFTAGFLLLPLVDEREGVRNAATGAAQTGG